jgi:hypothetical protein
MPTVRQPRALLERGRERRRAHHAHVHEQELRHVLYLVHRQCQPAQVVAEQAVRLG